VQEFFLGIDIEYLVSLLELDTDDVARRGRLERTDLNMKVLSYLSDDDIASLIMKHCIYITGSVGADDAVPLVHAQDFLA
jgi:hypothetical protein